MAASIASATVIVPSLTDSGGQVQSHDGIHGLHLLSNVVDTFLHQGNAKLQQNPNTIPIESRHYGVARVSACSSPTEDKFSSRIYPYGSLQEKARVNGQSRRATRARLSCPKGSTFRRSTVVAIRSKAASHLQPAIFVGAEGLRYIGPTLIPPSPPSPFRNLPPHQQRPSLDSYEHLKEQVQRLTNGQIIAASPDERHTSSAVCASPRKMIKNKDRTEKCSIPSLSKVSATALKANGEPIMSKKRMAELNYIKHKAVPMREKWMARFMELAEFKKKHGHTKVPHNFPDSPKLAEWQKFQRQQRKLFVKGKHSQLTPERVAMLEDIGFVWEARIDAWESHYQNLKCFKDEHGHLYVPVVNTVLSQWVKRQRKQYKKYEKGQESSLTDDRVNRLNQLGFIWDGRQVTD